MRKNNSILLFSGVVLGALLVFIPKAILVPLMFVSLALILGMFFIYSEEKDSPKVLAKIFILSLALRLVICSILAAVSYAKNGHVNFLYADDWGFNVNALDYLRTWKAIGHLPVKIWWMDIAGDITYPRWLAYLYYFIGIHTLVPSFINCSLGALSVIFVYLISKQIYNHKVAFWAVLLFTFWPSSVLWSTQNLKETLTAFIILYVLWSTFKLRGGAKCIKYWIFLLILIFIIYKINVYVFFVLLFPIIFSLIPISFSKMIKYSTFLVIMMYLFASTRWLGLYRLIYKYFGLAFYQNFSILDKINSMRFWRGYGADSAFLFDCDLSKPLNFIIYLPELLLYILFAPFPWAIQKPAQLFAAFEMLMWIFLFIPAMRGIFVTVKRTTKGSVILIFLIIMIIVFLGEGNVGTLFRHRAFIWPIWHMFIAAGLFYRIQKPIKA